MDTVALSWLFFVLFVFIWIAIVGIIEIVWDFKDGVPVKEIAFGELWIYVEMGKDLFIPHRRGE